MGDPLTEEMINRLGGQEIAVMPRSNYLLLMKKLTCHAHTSSLHFTHGLEQPHLSPQQVLIINSVYCILSPYCVSACSCMCVRKIFLFFTFKIQKSMYTISNLIGVNIAKWEVQLVQWVMTVLDYEILTCIWSLITLLHKRFVSQWWLAVPSLIWQISPCLWPLILLQNPNIVYMEKIFSTKIIAW